MENYAGTNQEHLMTANIAQLAHELTYRRYLLNNNRIRSFFQDLSIAEYLVLHIIKEAEQSENSFSERTYLKDLADKMHLTIRQSSRIAKALQDRGLLHWSHDGDGSEGTYVTITESGRNKLKEEEADLKEYYGKVIEKFGKDNLVQMLQLMKQFETVMSENTEGMEAAVDVDNRTDE